MTVMFHGCCHGCTMQELQGIDNCINCKWFDPGTAYLPDLNNSPPTLAETERTRIKAADKKHRARYFKDIFGCKNETD